MVIETVIIGDEELEVHFTFDAGLDGDDDYYEIDEVWCDGEEVKPSDTLCSQIIEELARKREEYLRNDD